jgi:hypothetical protein
MSKVVKTAVSVLLATAITAGAVSVLYAQDSPDIGSAPPPAPPSATGAPSLEATGESLRVRGDAKAMRVDVRRTTIGDVLAQLAAEFDLSYRASIALNDERNGTYAGSLGQVIARLLDGYDYVIRQQGSSLDLTILEKVGAQAVVAPRPHPVSEHRARLRAARR